MDGVNITNVWVLKNMNFEVKFYLKIRIFLNF